MRIKKGTDLFSAFWLSLCLPLHSQSYFFSRYLKRPSHNIPVSPSPHKRGTQALRLKIQTQRAAINMILSASQNDARCRLK